MSFLSVHEREILMLEYETLHRENWERGQTVWLVNSILIAGSLLISFQTQIDEFPTPIVSLFLVIMAFMMNATADGVTKITYKRMEEVRELLEMPGPKEMYRKIRRKWWYPVRKSLPYVLYLVMANTYIFIIVGNHWIVWTSMAAGFLAILIRELLDLVDRWIKESRRSV
jgi:hypothetical protein